ncbi:MULTISPECIES: type IVB secretion system protein IcmW [Cupriavidus]
MEPDVQSLVTEHPSYQEAPEFSVFFAEFSFDHERISQHFLSVDRTATLFSVIGFMDKVETWTVQRFADVREEPDVRARLRAQLERLAEVLRDYRDRIQPDNFAFVQVMAAMKASCVMYCLHGLQTVQPAFFLQLVDYCRRNEHEDVNAGLMLRRVKALFRTQMLSRAFGKENTERVMRAINRHMESH